MNAQVYINYGRFVAECTAEDCGDAREVQPGQTSATCANGHLFDLDWPAAAEQVMAAVAARPESGRSWFPADHPVAVATGQPHGKTVADLAAEDQQQAEGRNRKREQARAALAALGLELDLATGQVTGLDGPSGQGRDR